MDETETTKIIEAYGVVLEELSGSFSIYDEKNLPYPKSVIRNALYLKLREYPHELWETIQGGIEMYDSLVTGLYCLVMFQRDLGNWQIRIPNPDKDDLTQLDETQARSLTRYIDSIFEEIKETSEKMERLNIRIDVEGKIDIANTGLVLALGIVKGKLEERFREGTE